VANDQAVQVAKFLESLLPHASESLTSAEKRERIRARKAAQARTAKLARNLKRALRDQVGPTEDPQF
jgi:hypothetical protein